MTDAPASPAGPVETSDVAPPIGPGQTYMLVRVGTRWLGIEAQDIVEVAVKGVITRIPTAPRHVLGITSLRGGLVPVVSLAQLLGTTGSMSTDNGTVTPRLVVVAVPDYELALVVHEVGGLVSRSPAPSEAHDRNRPSFLTDEMLWDGRTVDIVDLAALAAVAAGTSGRGD